MVLQLEDFVGILNNIHTGIGFVFIFDHSCGHDRGIEEVLNVTKINIGYGRAQQ